MADFEVVHHGNVRGNDWTPQGQEWHPNASPIDPHNEPFKDASALADSKVDAPLPPNVVGGALELDGEGAADGVHAATVIDVTDDVSASKVDGPVADNIVRGNCGPNRLQGAPTSVVLPTRGR